MIHTEKGLGNLKTCLPTRYANLLQARLKKTTKRDIRTDVIRRGLMLQHQNSTVVKSAHWLAKQHNPQLYKKFFDQYGNEKLDSNNHTH